MKIFIICSVRLADDEYRKKLESYVSELEENGHIVHLPHRDTDQTASGLNICSENANAIDRADEVHIFYNPKSQGSHFDMGVAFALHKKIVIAENGSLDEKLSFSRMLQHWEEWT
jgi:nucleoside 2-deoxyribosyltransferase